METKMYVGNLSYNVGEDDLRQLFGQAGEVKDVALIMDRVEFFVDNQSIGFSTVAPYTRKWTIKMVDSPPRAGEQPVKRVDTVTNPDGTTSQVEVTVSEVIQQGGRLIRRYNTGMTAVLDASGYYETHVIYVKAYDAAGNVTESPHITIQVFHKKKS